MNSRRIKLLGAYALILAALAPLLPLWMDEILTLLGARVDNWTDLLDYIRTVPGGTPLAFLIPRWTMQLFGDSEFAVRLPSILASIAACAAVCQLARRAGIAKPAIAATVFAVWPLQLRYALEARPYMVALALSAWATEAFLAGRTVLYVALIALATLTQPYAIFIAIAHLAWSLFERRSSRPPIAALAIAAAALAPWYLYFRTDWSIFTAAHNYDPANARALLTFLREFTGAGYIGAALVLAAAAFAIRSTATYRALWITTALLPIALVLASNTAFQYFFATRQLIYVIPAFAILFAAGIEAAPRWGRALFCIFLAASLYQNVKWFVIPHEDWRAATSAVTAAVREGACVTFVENLEKGYVYFDPQLWDHRCATPNAADHTVLAASPYWSPDAYAREAQALEQRGLTKQSDRDFAGPRVAVFKRPELH